MYEAIQADRQRAYAIAPRLGRDPAEYSAASHLWGLSQDELFLAAYGGQVTFRRIGGNPINGWAETHLDWVGGIDCNLGEICYDDSMFDAAPSAFGVMQNVAHELGHGIDQQGGRQARADLATAWATEPLLQRRAGGFATGAGWQQNRDAGEGEVFADMFLGWTYGQWQSDRNAPDYRAGVVKSQYMAVNMPGVLALAVAGN
jgi:hypothetical protein